MDCDELRTRLLLADDHARWRPEEAEAHFARCEVCRAEQPEVLALLRMRPTAASPRPSGGFVRMARRVAAAVLLAGATAALATLAQMPEPSELTADARRPIPAPSSDAPSLASPRPVVQVVRGNVRALANGRAVVTVAARRTHRSQPPRLLAGDVSR